MSKWVLKLAVDAPYNKRAFWPICRLMLLTGMTAFCRHQQQLNQCRKRLLMPPRFGVRYGSREPVLDPGDGRHAGRGHLAICRHWDSIQPQLHRINFNTLLLSGLIYAVGLILLATGWCSVLFGIDPTWSPRHTLPAYLASHLGKYVPGKIMVFIIRRWMLPTVPGTVIIAVTIYETLVTMGVGALIGSLMLACYARYAQTPTLVGWAALMSFALGLTLLTVTWPSIFKMLSAKVALPFRKAASLAELPLARRVLLGTVLADAVSWILQGLAYVCVVAGLRGSITIDAILLLIGVQAVAVVLGFLSAVPGQAGVREGVLMLTAQLYSEDPVVHTLAPILFRVVTLTVECAMGSVLMLKGKS